MTTEAEPPLPAGKAPTRSAAPRSGSTSSGRPCGAHSSRGARARRATGEGAQDCSGTGRADGALDWTELGSQADRNERGRPGRPVFGSLPQTGRVSAIASDPSNANVVYLGGAAGGVWKSIDGGTSWTPEFPTNQGSFAIGAIAVDPSNPQNVWVGTGEPNNIASDTYSGIGIYRSANGGSSWTKVERDDVRRLLRRRTWRSSTRTRSSPPSSSSPASGIRPARRPSAASGARPTAAPTGRGSRFPTRASKRRATSPSLRARR